MTITRTDCKWNTHRAKMFQDEGRAVSITTQELSFANTFVTGRMISDAYTKD